MSRYIDADALKERLKKERVWMEYTAEMSVEQIAEEALLSAKQTVVRFVDEMPTVDAVPVRHGKWIRKKDTRFGEMLNDILICSECQIAFSTVTMIRRSYCPNCGARMSNET